MAWRSAMMVALAIFGSSMAAALTLLLWGYVLWLRRGRWTASEADRYRQELTLYVRPMEVEDTYPAWWHEAVSTN